MNIQPRTFSEYSSVEAENALNELLQSLKEHEKYQQVMITLGKLLGNKLKDLLAINCLDLLVSTAEDADYLAEGVRQGLGNQINLKSAIFWNNHYSIKHGSVAPIIGRYLEPGYETSEELILVKSIISGSCVVRTNLLSLIDQVNPKRIFIVAPVMHKNAETSLRKEFPESISKLFNFIYFALDSDKKDDGEVQPGIGGSVYELLGLDDQPAYVGFIPERVKQLMSTST